jgi:hypothetical protein
MPTKPIFLVLTDQIFLSNQNNRLKTVPRFSLVLHSPPKKQLYVGLELDVHASLANGKYDLLVMPVDKDAAIPELVLSKPSCVKFIKITLLVILKKKYSIHLR